MPNMTLSIDSETLAAMKAHPEIRWSEVARQAFQDKIQRLRVVEGLDSALAGPPLSESDIDRLAKDVKRRVAKRFRALRDETGR